MRFPILLLATLAGSMNLVYGDVVVSYAGAGAPIDTGGPFVGATVGATNQPNIVMAGVTAGDVQASGGVINPGLLGLAAGPGPVTRGGAMGAIDPNYYFSWGWTSSPSLNLSSITLGYGSHSGGWWGSNGPRQIQIALSVNGGAFQTIFEDNDVNITNVGAEASELPPTVAESHTIDLSAFSGVTSAEFRLYTIYAGGITYGGFDFLNVVSDSKGVSAIRVEGVNPSAAPPPSAVPEPATLLPVGLGLVFGAAALSRSRKRKQTE